MPKKLPTVELSISPRIAGRYATAAKTLKAKSFTAAPTAEKLMSRELMDRTPAGIVEDFEQGSWRRRSSNFSGVLVKKRG